MEVKFNIACIKAKSKGHYTCINCGSTEYIQGHHVVPKDDSTIIPLCAICHHSQHPTLSLNLFLSKVHQPYWHNKSASSLAKELKVHPRTIIRRAQIQRIPKGILYPLDEQLLRIRPLRRIYRTMPYEEWLNSIKPTRVPILTYADLKMRAELLTLKQRFAYHVKVAKERDEAGGNGK